MTARAVAFLITFLICLFALKASFERKPPEGQFLIDAKADGNPDAWPKNASQPASMIVCNPVIVPDAKEQRAKKVQQV